MVAGQVKIREVMFEYESKVQKTSLNLAADNFVEVCFLHRVPLKTHSVPQCSLFEHGTHIPYRKSLFLVPNARPPNHLATTAHPALRYRMPQSQKWEMHCRQRIYQTARKEEAIAKAQPGMPPKSFLTENHGITL